MFPLQFHTEISAIAADNRSGAAALAGRAAGALAALATDARGSDFTPLAEAASIAVARTQPSMAPVFRLANDALYASSDPHAFAAACRTFSERLEEADEAIGRHCLRLIAGNSRVLTHSFSRTVLRSLLQAHEAQREFGVIATESRPMNEGVALARELAAAGVDVALIADAAVNLFIDRAAVILVGADSITSHSVVNKIGTALIALAAAQAGKPVYTLCSSLKIAPPGFKLRESPRAAAELSPEAAGYEVWNYFFEPAPLALFAGVITEEGILSPADIAHCSESIPVHPALHDALR